MAYKSYSPPRSDLTGKPKDASESWKEEDNEDEGGAPVVSGGIGLLPNEVYDRQLHPLIAGFRKKVLKNLSRESEVLAAMQVRTCVFRLRLRV